MKSRSGQIWATASARPARRDRTLSCSNEHRYVRNGSVAIANRLDLTLRLVQGAGQASVPELAQRLGVSEMTVRRDLDALERQGLVRRVHGGAVPARARAEGGGVTARGQWEGAGRGRLGEAVAGLVEPGSRVL